MIRTRRAIVSAVVIAALSDLVLLAPSPGPGDALGSGDVVEAAVPGGRDRRAETRSELVGAQG